MVHGLEVPYRLDVDSDVPERRSLFKARSGEGLVFLDLGSDEYLCCYNYENPIDEYFLIAGLQSDTSVCQKLPIATAHWTDSPRCDSFRISAIDVARFSSALVTAYLRFRGRTIRDLLEVVQALGGGCSKSQATKSEVARIFDALLTMLPVQPECLFRSFCLLHFLDRYGHRADWVFGVQLFPFRAHCWVACGNELLNERPHAIEDYEVIHVAAQAEG